MSVEDILKALPSLETQRLTLRKFSTEDAQDLYEYASDVEIASLGLWYPFKSFEEIQQYMCKTGIHFC